MKGRFPFLWITLFFMCGILCHCYRSIGVENIAVVGVFVLVITYFFRRKKYIFGIFILFEFFVLGWLCTHSRWMFAQDHIYFQKAQIDFSQISVQGIIASEIRRSQQGHTPRLSFVLDLRQIRDKEAWEMTSGKVLVNLFKEMPLNYGDKIVLKGKLHRPFEFSRNKKFSYREYLKRQGIIYVLSVKKDSHVEILHADYGHLFLRKLYQWRSFASRLLARHLNLTESSLMQAMLLGERLYIPASLKDVFVKTGTAHILAISGLNVGIVVLVLFFLLRMIAGSGGMTYGLTIGFVFIYVLLTGGSPSVVRAGIMAIVFLTGFVIERETNGINSLSFAAFLILGLDPQNILDIGFQLSFVSVLAILLFYPIFMRSAKVFLKRYPNKVFKFVLETFSVSLAATIGVAGLIAYYFEIVTPVSLWANLIVVPLSTLATILGIGMLLSGGFIPFLGICIEFVLNLMVWFMATCQNFPFAYLYFQDVNLWTVISYYCSIIALWLWLEESKKPVVN